tara:strand:+ start:633 stop:908 length:276 start_codon:yes stop_codon:yes gene_type:complete
MTVSKIKISENISKSIGISVKESSKITEAFIKFIKVNSFHRDIKISGFGTFKYKETVKRSGRNPKTGESYIIPVMKKLNLNVSKKIKEIFN